MTDETRTPTPATLERHLETKFYNAVRKTLGGRAFKLAPIIKGTPDRMVLLPGGIIELVELKTDTGVISPKQRLWHSQAAMLGTTVTVVVGEAGLRDWVALRQQQLTQ